MWYAIAAIVVTVVGGVVWAVVRATRSGKARAERDQIKESTKRHEEALEEIAKPVPTDWARILQRRHARMARRLRDGDAGEAAPVSKPDAGGE